MEYVLLPECNEIYELTTSRDTKEAITLTRSNKRWWLLKWRINKQWWWLNNINQVAAVVDIHPIDHLHQPQLLDNREVIQEVEGDMGSQDTDGRVWCLHLNGEGLHLDLLLPVNGLLVPVVEGVVNMVILMMGAEGKVEMMGEIWGMAVGIVLLSCSSVGR
jgi:hypothetical protein